MQIKANFFATFKAIAGVNSTWLELDPDSTILEAVQRTVEKFPVLKPHWMDEKGELHAHVHVFLNSVDAVTLPLGLDTLLKEFDVLDFIPPVAGG